MIRYPRAAFPYSPPDMPAPPTALSSITIEASTFEVIHQDNAGVARQPASLTKLMTAYAAYACLEEGGRTWDEAVTIASTLR